MKVTHTDRGFELVRFIDLYGAKCSLQQSSLATQDAIWLGTDDADPKFLVEGKGWVDYPISKDVMFNTRMHLSVDDLKDLLYHLHIWLNTGSFKLQNTN